MKHFASRMAGRAMCALVLMAAATMAGAATNDKEITKYVRQLGADDYYARERASKWLVEHGEDAAEALLKATKSTDLEVSTRAAEILHKLGSGVTSKTPKDIAAKLNAIHSGQGHQRQQALQTFPWTKPEAVKGLKRQYRLNPDAKSRQAMVGAIRPEWPGAVEFLKNCYKSEKDVDTRKAIARALGPRLRVIVTPLLMDGKLDEAERLLSDAMDNNRNRTLMYDWVALAALTGKLDARIKEYGAKIKEYETKAKAGNATARKKAEADGAAAKTVLARLKRARGDAPPPAPTVKPKDWATSTNLPHWQETLKKLKDIEKAALAKDPKRTSDHWHYARVAIYAGLAGDKKARQEAVAKMRSFVGKASKQYPFNDWHPVKAMVAAGATDQAVDELLRKKNVRLAHQMRTMQGRYVEANALLRKLADDDKPDGAVELAYMAEQLLELGDKKRAGRLAELALPALAVEEAKVEAEAAEIEKIAKDKRKNDHWRLAEAVGNRRATLRNARLSLIGVLGKTGKRGLCRKNADVVIKLLATDDEVGPTDTVYMARILNEAEQRGLAEANLRDNAKAPEYLEPVVDAAANMGFHELAFTSCAQLLRRVAAAPADDAGGKDKLGERRLAPVLGTFDSLFPKKEQAAAFCLLHLWNSGEKMRPDAMIKTLREVVEAKNGTAPFLAMVRQSAAKPPEKAPSRAAWLELLARACREMGEEKQAAALDDKAMTSGPSASQAVRVGDRLREAKQWAKAATAYGQAWQSKRIGLSPNSPMPLAENAPALFLRGWSLVRSGKEAEGRRLMRVAKFVPLGNAWSRLALADAMEKVGMRKEAREERLLTARLGSDSGSFEYSDGGGPVLLGAKNWAAAEMTYVSETLALLTGSSRQGPDYSLFRDAEVPALVRIRETMAAGRVDEAIKALREWMRKMPASSSVLMMFMHPLDKLGRKKEADELFQIAFKALRERCRRDPKDAVMRNTLAWVCAVSARELDAALTYAKEATKLRPNDSSLLDTLAEVHFQRGEFDKARQAALDALKASPGRAFIQKRLLDFSRPIAELKKDLGPRPPAIAMF
jgi:tetratricopeptide (TPR) repeat protein